MKRFRFGRAFPYQINKVTLSSGHFHKNKDTKSWQDISPEEETDSMGPWRILVFALALITVFSFFTARLLQLQILEGSKNRDLADSNRIKIKVTHAPRGVIYDRNGKILGQNNPGFRLVEVSETGLKTTYITRDEALNMEVRSDPKFEDLEIDNVRTYPFGEKTAHVLGYIGEIDKNELKALKAQNAVYKAGDRIGRTGVEESYEKILKGVDGGEIIEVDARGKNIRVLRRKEAIAGHNLYLTLDSDLQLQAFNLLSESLSKTDSCCGALVAQDPTSGEILALVSLPSYNPTNIQESLDLLNSPLINRAIAGTYPPGSTFKIVSAIAGLSSGKISIDTQFEDTGILYLGPFKFTNWYFNQYGKLEGFVDLAKALKRSNDTYFYRMGQITGEKVLVETAKILGLDKKIGIDIPGEASGLVPDNEWKLKTFGEVWYPGDTLHMAIGQGFVLSTPLQIASLTSTIASDGKKFPPHLALKITNQDGKIVQESKYDSILLGNFQKSHIEAVKKGLSQVTKEGGTAWPFFTFPIETAGKTGTAEYGDPNGKTHAWYTTYAPADDPKIVVTVLIEGGGEGSSVAAPVAKELLRWYFSEDKTNLIKDVY